jgi:hypothetical protein
VEAPVLQPSTENADGIEDSAGAAVASTIVAELTELSLRGGLSAEAVEGNESSPEHHVAANI